MAYTATSKREKLWLEVLAKERARAAALEDRLADLVASHERVYAAYVALSRAG
jgi:hypothetical protein